MKNLEDRTGSALGTPLAFPEPSQRDRPTGSQPHELSPIFPLCPPCPPCEPVFSGNAGLESGRFFFSGRILSLAGFSSVPSVPSVRTPFLVFERRAALKRGTHKRLFTVRSLFFERLGTPDFSPACLFSRENLSLARSYSVFSVPSVRTLCFLR